jgi:hypothetical protein
MDNGTNPLVDDVLGGCVLQQSSFTIVLSFSSFLSKEEKRRRRKERKIFLNLSHQSLDHFIITKHLIIITTTVRHYNCGLVACSFLDTCSSRSVNTT